MNNTQATTGTYTCATGRDISALLNPRPIVIVGAQNETGDETCFATVAWVTPLSHSPAMLGFALREKSRTLELLRSTKAFSICLLPATQEGIALADLCGNHTGHREDKGALVPHYLVSLAADANSQKPSQDEVFGSTSCNLASKNPSKEDAKTPAHRIQLPIVQQSVSWITCSLDHIEQTGDHLFVRGTVFSAHTQCARDEKGRVIATDTLLCVQHDRFAAGVLL